MVRYKGPAKYAVARSLYHRISSKAPARILKLFENIREPMNVHRKICSSKLDNQNVIYPMIN